MRDMHERSGCGLGLSVCVRMAGALARAGWFAPTKEKNELPSSVPETDNRGRDTKLHLQWCWQVTCG